MSGRKGHVTAVRRFFAIPAACPETPLRAVLPRFPLSFAAHRLEGGPAALIALLERPAGRTHPVGARGIEWTVTTIEDGQGSVH